MVKLLSNKWLKWIRITKWRSAPQGESTLKRLQTTINIPSGEEEGLYIGIDFGGTNLRFILIEFKGNREFEEIDNVSIPHKFGKDSNKPTEREFFDFIVEELSKFMVSHDLMELSNLRLGFVFSFALSNNGEVNKAILTALTKEILISGVEQKDISKLMLEALSRKYIQNISLEAVINDTVAAIMFAAYRESVNKYDIASICGTGHNSCYVENNQGKLSIVNLESGGFRQQEIMNEIRAKFDISLDQQSSNHNHQLFEKMVAGLYLGEIFRIILVDLYNTGKIRADNSDINKRLSIKTEVLSTLINDESPDLSVVSNWMYGYLKIYPRMKEAYFARKIAQAICQRSARLVAATWVGIIKQFDPNLENNHRIAVDGSLFVEVPSYLDTIEITLRELLKDKYHKIFVEYYSNATSKGGAIAAATVERTAITTILEI